ncbi:unnamed protein product [Knipowitschia caucasica]|uniref:Uncharacterized protein n=1 Tax=Knipowitschia caucasica TaxID=637954 RepID=A0AAV2MFQ2_KNICA
MDKLNTVLNIANKNSNLGFGLVTLLTVGGEQIFSNVIFKCPCNQLNFLYGVVFLLVPALALLTLGFIWSKKTWKLVTGVCQRKNVCGSCGRLKALMYALFYISTFAFLAPSTWIAVALLNGVFTECAMTGTNMTLFNDHLCKGEAKKDCIEELPTFPCGKDGKVPRDVRDEVLQTLRAESQIIGWLLISTLILSHLFFMCLARCTSPVSYLQLKFWRLYVQEESSALDSCSAEHAKKLALSNVQSFFTNTAPEASHTPSNQHWQQVSELYKFRDRSGRQYYSTLHSFVEEQSKESSPLMKSMSVCSTGSGHIPPAALNFVDDAHAAV